MKVARTRRRHLLPTLPAQSGYHKRRRRVADTIQWLMGIFAARRPGDTEDLLTDRLHPPSSAHAAVQTVLGSALGEAAGYG